MLHYASVFASDTLVAQHAVYFPDAFLMREAMLSTLSFDEFIPACQRPLCHNIRINTLKISVADFLILTAPYGWSLTPIPWSTKDSGSSSMLPVRRCLQIIIIRSEL